MTRVQIVCKQTMVEIPKLIVSSLRRQSLDQLSHSLKISIDILYSQLHSKSVMGKALRNSKKPTTKRSKEPTFDVEPFKAMNSKAVSETLLECMHSGDLGAFRELLASHIMSANKFRLAQESGIARRTLYDILDPEMNFDPALSTVSAIIRGLAKC